MASATLTISGTKTGLPTGSQTIGPLTIASNATADADQTLNLASGNNTITIPVGATWVGVIIIPPSTNAAGLTLKGVSGDTGFPIHPALPGFYPLPAGAGSFIIAAGSAVNGVAFQWI